MSTAVFDLPGRINALQYRSHMHGNPQARRLNIGCSVFMSSVFNE